MPPRRSSRARSSSSGRASSFSEPIAVSIRALGGLGEGVGSYEKRRVLVPFSAPGDALLAEVVEEKSDGLHARIHTLQTPSELRVSPPCSHAGVCGGCMLQHVNEETYVQFKQDRLRRAIKDAGGEVGVLLPLLRVPVASRRRVTWHVQYRGDHVMLGFYAWHTHRVVDVEICVIASPLISAFIAPMRAFFEARRGLFEAQSVMVQESDTGLDVIITLSSLPGAEGLQILAEFAGAQNLARLSVCVKHVMHPVAVRRKVQMHIQQVSVEVEPGVFMQASSDGLAFIRARVLEALKGRSQILDLYAGMGAYSFALISQAKVHAVEGEMRMVRAMEQTIRSHQLAGRISVEQRDLVKRPLLRHEFLRFDGVVINPPRVGAKEQIQELLTVPMSTVVMVSCNPATFARDAQSLLKAGYRLRSVQGIDQFVYSAHVELVAVFSRN